MDNADNARRRVETHRELSAIRAAERRMAAEADELEEGLDRFEAEIQRAEQTIDVYLRQQNGGREPDHPASWRTGRAGSRRKPKGD
jgi:hypothetical protein